MALAVAVDRAPRLAPRRQPHGHVQWPARASRFDLDRAQSLECSASDDLGAWAIGTGQDDQQIAIRALLALAAPSDPVETPQLAAERLRDVLECLLAQLAAVLTGHLVEVLDH